MSSISVDYDVLNQKGSPAWYSDLFANLPTPGYKGRMFISTDTFAFYRDNGVGWDLVGGPGTGTITGAGVFGQVTFFSGTDTISGSTDLVWDNTNKRLGINTGTPGAPLDIHSTGTAAQFNGTTTNNAFVLFQNAGTSKWRIGNLYNAGANDYQIFDVLNSTARLTIKNTGASTLIGTFTATSLIKSGGTSSQILLADGTTTPTSTFGAGSVTNVSAITLGTSGTDLTSSVANSTTTPVITLNVPTASATNRGALSSADWTTFNNKQSTITLTTTGTSGAATLVGATLNIPNYTNVGTVTSVAALTLGTSGTDLSSSVANSTSTPVITLNVPTASATNRGALSSADFTTFNNKQATISVTAPVVLTGATISMPAATTSVNGYLTSTDWNTFNNKSNTNGTVTSVVALTIGTSGIDITSTAVTTTTTPVITLNIPTASASNRGALSSTDWTTFNNKQATLSLTTTGTSGAATLVANTLNVPNYTLSGLGGISGSGNANYLPKFTASTTIGNSGITDDGTTITTAEAIILTATSGYNITSNSDIILANAKPLRSYTTGASAWRLISLEADNNVHIAGNGGNILMNGGGNLGIGTVSPTYKLHISGGNGSQLLLDTTSQYCGIDIANTSSVKGGLSWDNTNAIFGLYTNGSLPMTFQTNNTERMRITTAGLVGIGTTSPSLPLEIDFSSSTAYTTSSRGNGLKIFNTSTTANVFAGIELIAEGTGNGGVAGINAVVTGSGSAALTFYTRENNVFSEKIRIEPSGNVGIGITAPTSLLHIYSSTTATQTVANFAAANYGSPSSITYIQIGTQYGDGSSRIGNINTTGNQSALVFQSHSATAAVWNDAMYINGSGNVGIATTTPIGKFSVKLATATAVSTIASAGWDSTYAIFGNPDTTIGNSLGIGTNSGLSGSNIVSLAPTSDWVDINYHARQHLFYSAGSVSPKISITSTGILNSTTRANFLGATDNALFSLNSGGTLYTVGFSPTATASSTNTFTLTTGTTTWIYTGTGTATWTLPNPSGNNQIYWIKNAGTGIITLNAFSGTNIINNAAASVSSITIAVGATAVIAQDGNVKSYQLQ